MSKRDREAEWQDKKAAMQDNRSIEDALNRPFESNPDRFLAILAEVKRNPEMVKAAKNGGRNLDSVEQSLSAPAPTYEAQPVYQPAPTRSNAKYASVIDRLDRFPFSEDEEVFGQQVKVVEAAMRTAMHEIIIKAVATNTKRAFKEFCSKITKAQGGLTVQYNFGKNKYAVTAKGNFFGDETICIYNSEDGVSASVVKIANGEADDLSGEFDISIREIK